MRPLAVALLAAAGCGATPPVDDTPRIDFSSLEYQLQPGEERYYCYTMRLPADGEVVFTRIVPTYGEGTHHILLSQTLAPEPEGFSDCDVLIKSTWVPIYAGGRESGALTVPAGAGLKMLRPGQQILMQLHLQNATAKPIRAVTTMRMETADPAKPYVAAGIFGYDNRSLTIPPNERAAVSSMSCVMDRALDVFGVLGHMHKRGRTIEISRGANAGDEMLYKTDWNFDDQPVTPLQVKVALGDTIHLRCTHENPTGQPITWGESSDQEMCAAIFYYTPWKGLDGCVKQ